MMKAKDRQLLFSFTGAMVSTIGLYLLFSWWAPFFLWFSLTLLVTTLFCYPIMYPEREVSFVNYAVRTAFYFFAAFLLLYLFERFHILSDQQ